MVNQVIGGARPGSARSRTSRRYSVFSAPRISPAQQETMAAVRARGSLTENPFIDYSVQTGYSIRLIHVGEHIVFFPRYLVKNFGGASGFSRNTEGKLFILEPNFIEQMRGQDETDSMVELSYLELSREDQCLVLSVMTEIAGDPVNRLWMQKCVGEGRLNEPLSASWAEAMSTPSVARKYRKIHGGILKELRWYRDNGFFPLHENSVKVLDVGCGDGALLVKLSVLFERLGIEATLFGVEGEPSLATRAREQGFQVIDADAANEFPFEDGIFDVVVSCGLANVDVVTPTVGDHVKAEMLRVASSGAVTFYAGMTPIIPASADIYGSPLDRLEPDYYVKSLMWLDNKLLQNSCALHSLIKR